MGALRALWESPPPSRPQGPERLDVGLAVAMVAATLLEAWLRQDLGASSAGLWVTLAITPALLWRRSRPGWATLAAFGGSGALDLAQLQGWEGTDPVALAFLLLYPHALLRWGSGRDLSLGVPFLLAMVSIGLWGDPEPVNLIGGYAIVGTSMALGAANRFRAQESRRRVEEAAQKERDALARELHDTVAHRVSAIAIRARAGMAVSQHDPEAAQEALGLIAKEASRALEEMRDVVRVLRQDDPTLRPAGDLRELTQAPGVPVVLEVEGDLEALSPATSATLYRLAQEAVTNARKHALGATCVRIQVRVSSSQVQLEVQDDGRATAPRGSGYGLRGMAERAALLGGSCEAGPSPQGGWRVQARLPVKERR